MKQFQHQPSGLIRRLPRLMIGVLGSSLVLPAWALGDPDVVTPLVVTVVAPPNPVLGADGRTHLAYELLILNQSPFQVTVDSVEVLEPSRRGAIASDLRGDGLAKVFRINGQERGATLSPSHSAYLFLDVAFPGRAELPAALAHRFSITLATRAAPDDGHHGAPLLADGRTPSQLQFSSVPMRVNPVSPVILSPPLKGPRWLAANGCCATITSHRGATIAVDGSLHLPERFAIDFVQLNEQNRMFTGPIEQLTSYPFFGAGVYSVADGRVVGTQDGLPEGVPGKLPTNITMETAMQLAGGNYVVVDIGKGRYAFYAHLQPGSLKVRKGSRVRRGQLLGLLGDSGNSDAPHLHFHVMDGPSPLGSNGLPFVFASFYGQGMVTDEAPLFQGDPARIDPTALAGPHRNALPLNDQIVSFP